MDDIEMIKQLKDAGVISEAEYTSLKAKLIS